ncbi:SDR family NAD(P)-dependent oxidoreductase [Mesorhizobium sp.]|uniref:SDR family NAD(P)-dependent oxidoreductase n=1 Tax=Mesorhizobium sp. TaxID=1871066 RepID=UPI0034395363
MPADLATSAGIAAVVEHVKKSSRPLDVLVNNAGVAFLVPFETRQRGAVPAILRAQCDGGVLPHPRPAAASRGAASVINISSYSPTR